MHFMGSYGREFTKLQNAYAYSSVAFIFTGLYGSDYLVTDRAMGFFLKVFTWY